MNTAAANKSVVINHFRALERGDLEGALTAFTPNLINHRVEPGSPPGRAGLAATLGVVLQCFPSAVWRVENIVADSELVAAVLVIEGTAHGVIMGVQAKGQQVTWRHTHWFRMSGGKVVEHDAIRDDRGLLRQLGMNVRGPHPGGLGGGFSGVNVESAAVVGASP
ncbi:ester cyclase [Frankia sp. Cr2]|uniref:ester cyclase n=1 Tax=Frankia sp. Cr2 TaxID=3073932 RepID=UPI002AD341EA|nr:ester cyclase [Frankia sp. Cr2]